MERHTTLNKELNESCEKNKLTSWTKHVNHRGIVYTIRFDDKSAMFDPNDPENVNSVTYKPKSRYHVKRDFLRVNKFNHNFSYDRPLEKCDFDNNTADFEIHHSKPVLIANNKHYTHTSTTHESSFCLNEFPQAMNTDCRPHISSVDKILKPPPVIMDSPPVECDSVDVIMPIVYLEAAISLPPPIEYVSAESVSMPDMHEPTEHVLSPLSTPIFECEELISPKYSLDPVSPFSYDESPIRSFVEKQLTSKDILCDSCSGTVPNGTSMLYCDVCSLHLCGSCIIYNSYSHSTTCDNKLRYMKETELHLQYVPDSDTDNSTVSDCSRPPETSTQLDQEVPCDSMQKDKSYKSYAHLLNSLVDYESVKQEIREAIETATDEAFQRRYGQSFGK